MGVCLLTASNVKRSSIADQAICDHETFVPINVVASTYTGKFRGENNPCWMGGPTASNRRERIRLREKRAELKRKGIEHLGGKCIECGYNKCIDGLDFHHPDPTKKDPDFSKKCETTWAKMKMKIKGCIVICCRCHRELHWNERQKIYEEEKKLCRI